MFLIKEAAQRRGLDVLFALPCISFVYISYRRETFACFSYASCKSNKQTGDAILYNQEYHDTGRIIAVPGAGQETSTS